MVIIFAQAVLKRQVATTNISEKNHELEYFTYTGSYISPRVFGEPAIINGTAREKKFTGKGSLNYLTMIWHNG